MPVVVAVAVPVVMTVVAGLVDDTIGLEQANTQQQRQGNLPFHRAQDARILLHLAKLCLHRIELRVIDEVCLVEHQDVAVDHLRSPHLACKGFGSEVLCVNQGDDRVKTCVITQLAAQKGHCDGEGISQACCLHHEIFHGFWSFENAVDSFQQFTVDRAADAAVAQLDHVLIRAHHQFVVDTDLPELIDQNGCLEAVLIAEDVIQECGFARSEKARENRHWYRGVPGRAGRHCVEGMDSFILAAPSSKTSMERAI